MSSNAGTIYQSILRPLLFRMEAEHSHELAMKAGKILDKSPLLRKFCRLILHYRDDKLCQNIWGIDFPNPIGLAAGFDKNGHLVHTAEALGFGFIEVGSITAEAHPGNTKPRLFRLPPDRSIINRMGLNNDGAETIIARLRNNRPDIPLGINIAKTNNPKILGDKAIEDYQFSYRFARQIADYITINISCPNTGDGKSFEDPAALDELLSALNTRKEAGEINTLIKFSVDLDRSTLEELVRICENHGIKGYVVANTSSRRRGLSMPAPDLDRIGEGGLSGSAIADQSTQMIRQLYQILEGRKPIIGVGGIDSFEQALHKLEAGASLIQIYTGLIYEGPSLVKRINKQLASHLSQHKLHSIRQLDRH
jgi:dihydroorotate dehydrogenase